MIVFSDHVLQDVVTQQKKAAGAAALAPAMPFFRLTNTHPDNQGV